MSKYLKTLAATVALGALVFVAAPARADLVVTVQEDGGSVVTIANVKGSPTGDLVGGTFTSSTADYKIQFSSGEANQTAGGAELLSSTLSITKTGTGTGALHFVITGTGYTGPTTPPVISAQSHIGGTIPVEGTNSNSLSFESFVNGVGVGTQSPSINLSPGGSFNSDASMLVTSLSAPYSIAENLNISLNNVGDQINYSTSTTLTPTPAPAGLVLALTGLPVLGLGYWRRRQKQRQAA